MLIVELEKLRISISVNRMTIYPMARITFWVMAQYSSPLVILNGLFQDFKEL